MHSGLNALLVGACKHAREEVPYDIELHSLLEHRDN